MFIGTQIGARHIFDRDPDSLLAEMQELSRVNTVMTFFNTYSAFQYRGSYETEEATGKRVDETYVRQDPRNFEGLEIGRPTVEDRAYDGRDVVEELLAAAEPRGMDVFVRMLEPGVITEFVPGLTKAAELDAHDRYKGNPCFNHPDYIAWTRALWEDVIKNHPKLAGIKYGQERGGPLMDALRGEPGFCFCEHCQRKAHRRGLDLERGRAGWLEMSELGAAAVNGEDRPADGWFASLMRIWMKYPEMLGHHRFWMQSREDMRRMIYGLAKTLNPDLQVGWHIDHHWCWDLLGRAAVDFAEMTPHSDWLSIALYFDCAGPRMAGHVSRGIATPFLGDLPRDLALDVYRYMVGQDPKNEPGWEAMERQEALSAEHVYGEVKRAKARVQGKTKIYARVGFDVPMYECRTTPEQVREATRRAWDAGADGFFVTREWDEAAPENRAAFGEVMDEIMGR